MHFRLRHDCAFGRSGGEGHGGAISGWGGGMRFANERSCR
jgi:hypothetical protein